MATPAQQVELPIEIGRQKHLELIHAVISRMAQNSFIVRGWSIALVTAVLAVASKELNAGIGVLAAIPVLSFWYLDAFYLRQERLFRQLYSTVIERASSIPQFSMDTKPFEENVEWKSVLFSPTIAVLHGALFLIVLAISTAALVFAAIR